MNEEFWGGRARRERGWGRDWRRWAHDWARDWGKQWERGDRMFAKGDLKYLILDLLKERPRHGYDMIRELGDRFGGFYTPSPGAVYPTLQLLEDMGAVTSVQQDGRKVYTITDEGRRILDERSDVIGEVRDRVRDWVGKENASELHKAMHELGELMSLLGREGPHAWKDPSKLRRIRELIARTREELHSILRDDVTV